LNPTEEFTGNTTARPAQNPLITAGFLLTFTPTMKRDFFIVIALTAGISYGATMAATANSRVDDVHTKCLKASDYVGCLSVHSKKKKQAPQSAAKPQPEPKVQETGFGFLASWIDPKEVGSKYGGYRVTRIFKDSPAEKAGLSTNDQLVKIGKVDAKLLTARQISILIKDDMSDGEIGPLTFRNTTTGSCETFKITKGTYMISKEEKKAIISNNKKALEKLLIDKELAKLHKKAKLLIKSQANGNSINQT